MRFFHWMILTYSLLSLGCGFKTTPVWRETPKHTQEEASQAQKSLSSATQSFKNQTSLTLTS